MDQTLSSQKHPILRVSYGMCFVSVMDEIAHDVPHILPLWINYDVYSFCRRFRENL